MGVRTMHVCSSDMSVLKRHSMLPFILSQPWMHQWVRHAGCVGCLSKSKGHSRRRIGTLQSSFTKPLANFGSFNSQLKNRPYLHHQHPTNKRPSDLLFLNPTIPIA